jgi:hypothetical protein
MRVRAFPRGYSYSKFPRSAGLSSALFERVTPVAIRLGVNWGVCPGNSRKVRRERPRRRLVALGFSTALDDDDRAGLRNYLGSKNLHRRDPALAVGYRADVQQDNAVLRAIDEPFDPRGQADAILAPQSASEHAVLQWSPIRLRELVHGAQAPWVSNVVREYVGTHGSPCRKCRIARNIALDRASEETRLDVERPTVRHLITKSWMRNHRAQPSFYRANEKPPPVRG